MADTLKVPADFKLGVSTASHQIEGAWREDGKGESIWDRFGHTPGKIERGENADVACDSYHRWAEDLDLIADAGMDVYRFSLAWPRIFPRGTGAKNAVGLDHYDRIIDGCLERGIEPWPCLYHWDLPQALEDRGGWPNPDSPAWFEDYAGTVASRYGDRVTKWVTFNEPSNPAILGYAMGVHAPGRRDLPAALHALHHLNLAHIRAADVIRAEARAPEIGIVLALNAYLAPTEEDRDRQAADLAEMVNHESFTGPLLHGAYPDTLKALHEVFRRDEETIRRAPDTLDWMGVNYYGPFYIGFDEATGGPAPKPRQGRETTAIGWEIEPEGLTRWLVKLKEKGFEKPVYVTENGFPLEDERVVDGRVHDARRVAYVRDHLEATLAAREQGVDVRGYLAWTLVDNFEWSFGWRTRFGLCYLDLDTQARTPKDSYRWLQEVARNR